MKKVLFLLAIGFGFLSCEKDEIPRAKPTAGSANVVSVSMGGDYANQLFFSLKENKVLLKNNREVWDLGFESAEDGFHVILNGAKLMAISKTNVTNLADVTSVEGVEWNWDRPSGNYDSTAVGDWRNSQNVYLLNRGTSLAGTPLGHMKFKVISVNATSYQIEWAELTETTSQVSTIVKNSAATFTCFSFNNGGQTLSLEPPKETWDLCFTSYTHVFDAHTPYLVTGVISNRHGVRVKPVNDKTFSAITYVDYLSANFDNHINNIGYNWKVYDFDNGQYVVDNTQNFIIETSEGRVYKLHFLDYYDDFGVKGTPTMEIQEMVP